MGTVVKNVAVGQTFLPVRLASTVNYYSTSASSLFTCRPVIIINGSIVTLSQNITTVINKQNGTRRQPDVKFVVI